MRWCLILALIIPGAQISHPSAAFGQTRPVEAEVVFNTMKEWTAEKNKLLNRMGIKVDVDGAARETLFALYRDRAEKFLGIGDSAYRQVGSYLIGPPALDFLDKQEFYKLSRVNKRQYEGAFWIRPQVDRNVKGLLDQFLVLHLAEKPGDKNIVLRSELIKKYEYLFDDCDLPPRTRLWCRHEVPKP